MTDTSDEIIRIIYQQIKYFASNIVNSADTAGNINGCSIAQKLLHYIRQDSNMPDFLHTEDWFTENVIDESQPLPINEHKAITVKVFLAIDNLYYKVHFKTRVEDGVASHHEYDISVYSTEDMLNNLLLASFYMQNTVTDKDICSSKQLERTYPEERAIPQRKEFLTYTNLDFLRNATEQELAEFSFLTSYTKDSEGKTHKMVVGYDGTPYASLEQAIQANKKWLREPFK